MSEPAPFVRRLVILLGASHYEVRLRDRVITGCTRLDIGRHVEPGELRALANRLGRTAELQRRIEEVAK